MAIVDIPAPMRGSVLEVLAAVGTSVTVGDELIILESMKMEIPVESPESGTVSEVLVQPGDKVEEGDPIVRLESA
jgi:acetyl-CoA carboxylase biotin carboxyl carrier protein